MTFNPTSPGVPIPVAVAPGNPLFVIDCPVTTQCAAAGPGGEVVTFDPTSPSDSALPAQIDGANTIFGIACKDTTQCTVVDDAGAAMTFLYGAQPLATQRVTIDNGHALFGLACRSTGRCVGVDSAGNEVTFDAGAPPSSPPANASVNQVDANHPLQWVACPSDAQCSAVDDVGTEVTFDPGAPSNATSTTLEGGTVLNAVDCSSVGRCVAVSGDGREATFVPSPPASTGAVPIDLTPVINGVACPTATQCTAVDAQGQAVTFNPRSAGGQLPSSVDSDTLYGIACPSADQCTAVDASGLEVTFNPTSPGTPTPTTISDDGPALEAVACPATFQCTAVDDVGQEVTFNPQSAPGNAFANQISQGSPLTGVACVSTSECVAVDVAGEEITFAPGVPFGGGEAPVSIDSGHALQAVTCPSASQCTAVDDAGQQITFNPSSPSGRVQATIDGGQPLNAIVCTSTSHCFATDRSGRAIEGDPTSAAAWAVEPITAARSLNSVACSSAITCVTVDSTGQGATGVFPVPVNTSAPTIVGEPTEGKTLTESHGGWTNAPTSFSLQWEDCDASGSACAPIPGANSQAYTLGAADVGHTIVVVEAAVNPGGSSNPVRSTPTLTVQAPTRPAAFLTNVQFTATTATFSGSVVPDGLATGAHFEYNLDQQYFGATPTPIVSTDEVPVGSDFAAHPVSATVTGLVPNAIYHVRVVASNPDGTARSIDKTFTTKLLPPPPDPVIARSVNVTPTGGHVLIRPPRGKGLHLAGRAAQLKTGKGFIPLTQVRQIPAGSQIDARRGTLRLVSATGVHHKLQRATFSGALFDVSQTASGAQKGLTTLTLLEDVFRGAPSLASCRTGARAKAALSARTLQLLHAKDNHGKFRTRGRSAAATSRGTSWTMADRCDGTLTHVQSGIVSVLDFTTHKTILLHAGQSHLAKAPTRKH
ncbi:MAG TPA: fibronectin type III domain-containing protein [Solirubrobacteraceae bacterium]|nr:fibronectin type III domain-containing protein [Solirubrobacteraceae bacterium]